ncbi:TauD/TfdA family dioxygenase [Fulvivirga sp. 29W222]|uniref:TauD/TfdA family dioxygenase n=1 Tax=Fulvivirga marina TaxID=2494733 RepID=A0A937FTZ5_9BACT|nr:TauD/TfdA family dioxygenase [Fulvivirga marina]MBL6445749.1 TauD/TfdA family dioxygenase [Fulvivirga marina]
MTSFEFDEVFKKNEHGYYEYVDGYADKFNGILQDGDGYLLVRGFDFDSEDRSSLELDLLKFAFTFGLPVSQSRNNEFLVRVEDVVGQNEPSNVSTRGYEYSGALPPHNDRCDLFMLVGVHASKEGGRTRLMNSAAVCKDMQKTYPDYYEFLKQDYPVDRSKFTGKDGDISYYPIIFETEDGDLLFWYTRHFIDSALKYDKKYKLSEQQEIALKFLDEIIDEHNERCLLQRGDVLFVNNHKALHARQKFLEGDNRLLYRIWLSTPESKKLPLGLKSIFGRVDASVYRGGVWSEDLPLEKIPSDHTHARRILEQMLIERN